MPKIYIYDIETAPHLVYSWGLYKQNISPNMVVRNGTLMSVAWKELGNPVVHYVDCRDYPDNDSPVVAAIWDLFDSADIVIGQNSKQFDTRKVQARMIELGMPPPSPFKQIDTKEEAKKIAAFTSNKLEWLSEHLSDQPKSIHAKYPGFTLWSECLAGDNKAWEELRKYNIQDVLATEEVYLKLRPWIVSHPNLAVHDNAEIVRCPKCNSDNVQYRGYMYTQVGKYHRLHCGNCGGWSRTRYTEHQLGKRQTLLGN